MKRKPTFAPYIGTVTYSDRGAGLDNTAEVIDILSAKLLSLLRQCRVDRETRKAHVALVREASDGVDKGVFKTTTEALVEALSHYAPPYTYFGERDGDYGFWPEHKYPIERLNSLDAASCISELWGRDLLFDDKGTLTCGRFDKRGRFHSYWSAV